MHASRVLIILAMAAITYMTRVTAMLGLGSVNLPSVIRRAFRYIPVGVLTGLIVPSIVLSNGEWAISYSNPLIWGAITSIAVARRWRSPLLAMVLGMFVVSLIRLTKSGM